MTRAAKPQRPAVSDSGHDLRQLPSKVLALDGLLDDLRDECLRRAQLGKLTTQQLVRVYETACAELRFCWELLERLAQEPAPGRGNPAEVGRPGPATPENSRPARVAGTGREGGEKEKCKTKPIRWHRLLGSRPQPPEGLGDGLVGDPESAGNPQGRQAQPGEA